MRAAGLWRGLVAALIWPLATATAWGQANPVDAQRAADERVVRESNIDEAKVGFYTLPDPLTTLDGNPVRSVAEWESVRRPEILHLFEVNQFGVTPANGPKARFEIWEKAVPALDGKARRTQVRIRFSDAADAPVIRVLLYTPAAAKKPVPVLEYISFSPNSASVTDPGVEEGFAWNPRTKTRIPGSQGRRGGSFDPNIFLDKGFGVVLVNYGDIDPDFEGGAALGIRSQFGPVTEPRKGDEWGTIGTWSWGLSRVLDYLETEPSVDAKRVAVTGVSRLGKTALWAGAQDRRFAMVIPVVSGEGGAALSRRNFGEFIGALTDPARFPYWFAPNYAGWADKVDRFPVDSHMLLALVAPRPVMMVVGAQDTWSDWRGEYLAARAAEPVYALYGKRFGAKVEPAVGQPVLNDIGFYKHAAGHTMGKDDLEAMAAFMQKHFGR